MNLMITKDIWDKIRPESNPFLHYEFINCLIDSKSIGESAGWIPKFFVSNDSALMTFIKTHSYGEYIFDWGWAEAYERYGIPYYPKLTSMIPFTPVTTQHFLMNKFSAERASSLLKQHDEFLDSHNLSSAHFLFLNENEEEIFKINGYQIRDSFQYHFINTGLNSFEDFLKALKTKKAKTIKRERLFPTLDIRRYSGDDLTEAHADRMYQFYISTIANKNSYDYLNHDFFRLIFNRMKLNILYIEATEDNVPIAGSLFFFDHEKLYGRYWGSNRYIENLHFELCYYQGIDFCLEKKLKVFEAGAQGEHKIARGFTPVRVRSAHKIKHSAFASAISDFIETEKRQVQNSINQLSAYLPFKK